MQNKSQCQSNKHRLADAIDRSSSNEITIPRVFVFGGSNVSNKSDAKSTFDIDEKKTKDRTFSIGIGNETDNKPKSRYGIKKRKQPNVVDGKKTKTACVICNDFVDGRVSLKCCHEMCPTCFARHARVNNTCPFCRDEFAPKINKNTQFLMPIRVAEAIASTNVQDYYHYEVDEVIEKLLNDKKSSMTEEDKIEFKNTIYHHMFQSAMGMYFDIKFWIQDNE